LRIGHRGAEDLADHRGRFALTELKDLLRTFHFVTPDQVEHLTGLVGGHAHVAGAGTRAWRAELLVDVRPAAAQHRPLVGLGPRHLAALLRMAAVPGGPLCFLDLRSSASLRCSVIAWPLV